MCDSFWRRTRTIRLDRNRCAAAQESVEHSWVPHQGPSRTAAAGGDNAPLVLRLPQRGGALVAAVGSRLARREEASRDGGGRRWRRGRAGLWGWFWLWVWVGAGRRRGTSRAGPSGATLAGVTLGTDRRDRRLGRLGRLGRGSQGPREPARALDYGLTHRVHHALADPLLLGGWEVDEVALSGGDVLGRVLGWRVLHQVTQHWPGLIGAAAPGSDDGVEVSDRVAHYAQQLCGLARCFEHSDGRLPVPRQDEVRHRIRGSGSKPVEPESSLAVAPTFGSAGERRQLLGHFSQSWRGAAGDGECLLPRLVQHQTTCAVDRIGAEPGVESGKHGRSRPQSEAWRFRVKVGAPVRSALESARRRAPSQRERRSRWPSSGNRDVEPDRPRAAPRRHQSATCYPTRRGGTLVGRAGESILVRVFISSRTAPPTS